MVILKDFKCPQRALEPSMEVRRRVREGFRKGKGREREGFRKVQEGFRKGKGREREAPGVCEAGPKGCWALGLPP